jgi:hypothetical protein
MKKQDLQTVAEVLSPFGYGLISMISERLVESSNKSNKIIYDGDDKDVQREIDRKVAEAKILELEAKISQELAIAERIANAIDVEIEEYYEGSGSGKIGGGTDGTTVNLELSGGGKKVIKRIYKFKGNLKNQTT